MAYNAGQHVIERRVEGLTREELHEVTIGLMAIVSMYAHVTGMAPDAVAWQMKNPVAHVTGMDALLFYDEADRELSRLAVSHRGN